MAKSIDTFEDEFSAGLAALRQDVSELTRTIGGFVQQQANGATHTLSDSLGDTRDSVVKAAGDMQAKAKSVGADIEAGIERHPMTALLVIFGMGMSLGLMSRARS